MSAAEGAAVVRERGTIDAIDQTQSFPSPSVRTAFAGTVVRHASDAERSCSTNFAHWLGAGRCWRSGLFIPLAIRVQVARYPERASSRHAGG